jgi:preprotein translocase subunit SecD
MEARKKNIWVLVIIVGVVILSGFFVYPNNRISNIVPWRLGLDLVGGSALIYEIDLTNIDQADRVSEIARLKTVIEGRVNPHGVAESKVATIKKGDGYQLLVELAGVNVEDAVRQIGETPVLDFREVETTANSVKYVPTELTGRYLKKASMEFSGPLSAPVVLLEFNEEGAKLFADITARNVGKPLAVFLDGASFTEPIVQQEITGGSAQISGGESGFTPDEAKSLAGRFDEGALSAPIHLISQRQVSASAADNSLDQIILAGLIGTAMVLAFMIIFYRSFGVFASIALLMYIVLTLALFKLFPGFTMTLSGIAGFILSIGMAVDANILIFERTKEELGAGHSRSEAIQEGFKRAWPSIRDSNTTTIITSTILYALTSSFVKGFALTLGLGVIVSMFSAIFITRTILRVFAKI